MDGAHNLKICPMGTSQTYRSTLLYACVLVGGEEELARRLGVTVEEIVTWLFEERIPPTPTFLKAVDIVLTARAATLMETKEMLRISKEMLERIRASRPIRKPALDA
jgi:hypothetical protein